MPDNNLYIATQVWDTHEDLKAGDVCIMEVTQGLLDKITKYQKLIEDSKDEIIKITVQDTVAKYLKARSDEEYEELEKILKPVKTDEDIYFTKITEEQYKKLSGLDEVFKRNPMLEIYGDDWRTCTYSLGFGQALIYTNKISIKNYDLQTLNNRPN